MRAEHKVTVEAGGQKRTMRGLIAVQRPDRFRLRALGPAGLTLFDVISVGGEVQVVESIKDPNASALGKILPSMAGDLQAAYDLEPRPAERTVAHEGDETVDARERAHGARDGGAHRHRQRDRRLQGARRRRCRRQRRDAGSGVVGEVESAAS